MLMRSGSTIRRRLKALAFLPLLFALTSTAGAQTLTLRFAHNLSATEPYNIAAEKFAADVATKSNGGIKITVFPNEQLGANKEMLELVKQGANIITITDSGYMADFVPDFGILQGPYLLRNPNDFKKLLASDLYKELVSAAKAKGMMPLAFNWYLGSRHVISNRAINSLADFKGLSLRAPPIPMYVKTVEGLGARPVTLAWSDVYTGLSQGVVDGAEAPLPTIYGTKLYEVRQNIALTGHFANFLGIIMNAQVFDKLTAAQKAILTSEGEAAGEYLMKLTLEKEKTVRADLEMKGVKFTTPANIEQFQRATASVYREFPKWTPGLYERVQKILQYN
ncbi:MAG: C4-dicarboxylate TRAP transporter substrate-binding protein [Betaproteobacteria bacterium]|nr:C4-dicarboxylate TRAP transporter substrate-binding protein [Betaproteobacteria bacterium]